MVRWTHDDVDEFRGLSLLILAVAAGLVESVSQSLWPQGRHSNLVTSSLRAVFVAVANKPGNEVLGVDVLAVI